MCRQAGRTGSPRKSEKGRRSALRARSATAPDVVEKPLREDVFLYSAYLAPGKTSQRAGRSARDFFFERFCVNFCSLVGLWGLFGGCPWVRFGGQGAFCGFLIDLGFLFYQRAWRFRKSTVINTRLNAIIDFYLVFMTGDLLKHHAGA